MGGDAASGPRKDRRLLGDLGVDPSAVGEVEEQVGGLGGVDIAELRGGERRADDGVL
jgi:hypothetical protein